MRSDWRLRTVHRQQLEARFAEALGQDGEGAEVELTRSDCRALDINPDERRGRFLGAYVVPTGTVVLSLTGNM